MAYPLTLELARDPLTQENIPPFCLQKSMQTSGLDPPSRWSDLMTLPQIRKLMDYYFGELHLLYPILDKSQFLHIEIRKLVENGLRADAGSCLLLLIFALGSLNAYHHGDMEWGHDGLDDCNSPAGIGFFNEARRILPFLPKGRHETAQCHLLAG